MNKPREQGEHVRLTSFALQNLKKERQTTNVSADFAETMRKAKPVANVSGRNAQTFIKVRNAEGIKKEEKRWQKEK